MDFVELFFWLLVGHAVADFGLQSAYMAEHKNPVEHGTHGWIVLIAHSLIHGGAVAYATGLMWLGLAEVIAHMMIDHRRANGRLTLVQDQSLHVVCKLLWAGIAMMAFAG